MVPLVVLQAAVVIDPAQSVKGKVRAVLCCCSPSALSSSFLLLPMSYCVLFLSLCRDGVVEQVVIDAFRMINPPGGMMGMSLQPTDPRQTTSNIGRSEGEEERVARQVAEAVLGQSWSVSNA